jgi:hypothetical protein
MYLHFELLRIVDKVLVVVVEDEIDTVVDGSLMESSIQLKICSEDYD